MTTVIDLLQAASGGGPEAGPAIDTLAAHRREVASRMLASVESDEELAEKLPILVGPLAAAAFPWNPSEADYALAVQIFERWGEPPAPPPNVLMAAMALAPAHHFPAPPRLAEVPTWLRLYYANYLFGRPHVFLNAGECEHYAAAGLRAMAMAHAAVFEDRVPGAFPIAELAALSDSGAMYFSERSLRPFFRDKARITEWFMLQQGYALGCGFAPSRRQRPRIGILHRSLKPGTESYHLLGHLVGRDRSAAEIRIYLLETSDSHLSAAFEAWTDALVQLHGDVSEAVEQMRGEDLDLCFISNNIAWTFTVEAAIAAHRVARVQVVSGASPCSPGFTSSDLFLTNPTSDPTPQAQDDYEERLAFLPGAVGAFGFALDRDPATMECSRALMGIGEDELVFFSGANCYKLTPELIDIWAEILSQAPNSRLFIMPFNPNWGTAFPVELFLRRMHRQLVRLGVAPHRIQPIAQVPTRADLHAIMAQADVYLDSFPYAGACSLVDPLQVGLPIVARAGSRLRAAQGASLLLAEGLEEAVCPDTASYIARAVRLARDAGYREAQAALARRKAQAGLACLDTASFANRFAAFCACAIDAAHSHAERLHRASGRDLLAATASAAAAALAARAPAFLGLQDVELARQLIVPWLRSLPAKEAATVRVFDVGARQGAFSARFLAAGFRVEMFEPDLVSAPALGNLVAQHPGSARHWTSAPLPPAMLNEHHRRHPGPVDVINLGATGANFDILAALDLAAMAPRLVMLEYGTGPAGDPPGRVAEAIERMRRQGFAALVFEHQRLAAPSGGPPLYHLADVAFDADRLGQRGDGCGYVLFYRQADTAFLACAVALFESYAPAPTRPALAALPSFDQPPANSRSAPRSARSASRRRASS